MGIIRQLPQAVVEKIAAGEVVERPASVVKELIENAIDADAAAIAVEIASGGAERITVIDDGCGMEPEDLGRSILRHATSKIRGEADLWRIGTMGFRGEALCAIGAVSRLTIESRVNRPEVLEGARLEVEGGAVRGPVPAGCAGGTRVLCEGLFFNVPARRKFLRSENVEAGHVAETVEEIALAHPRIRFELTSGGSRRFSLPACADDDAGRRERAIAVMGERMRDALIPVAEENAGIAVRGLIAAAGRSGGRDVHLFLNRRPIRDRMLMHAVIKAFGERCPAGQYPAAVLWIEIDPAKVDVNVHPAKREVRFAEGGAVHDFVTAAIRKHLDAGAAAVVDSDAGRALLRYEQRRREQRPSVMGIPGPTRERSPDCEPALQRQIEPQARLRPLGQFANTYIACEDEDGALVLIDQHAAHERLGFDALKRQYREGGVAQQRLLMPEHLELGAKPAAYLLERLGLLQQAGFEVEPFGGNSIVVKSVPALLGAASMKALFERLAWEFEELGTSGGAEEALERVFAVTACHRQVRAGDRLRPDEMASLVRDIEQEQVKSCPHGRPALVRIELRELDRWFQRS